MNNLETVQSQLFDVKKIQLHSGLEGYDSPEMFGVYKSNGGKPLGVVGKVFEPMDLNLFIIMERETHSSALLWVGCKRHANAFKVKQI